MSPWLLIPAAVIAGFAGLAIWALRDLARAANDCEDQADVGLAILTPDHHSLPVPEDMP